VPASALLQRADVSAHAALLSGAHASRIRYHARLYICQRNQTTQDIPQPLFRP